MQLCSPTKHVNRNSSTVVVFLILSLGMGNLAVAVPMESNMNTSTSSTPLVGTFFYGWYKGQDDDYQAWDHDFHNPPITWASHFLPDIGNKSNAFDPPHNLYASDSQYVLTKQLKWMKQAGIEFGILSWWGIGSRTDKTFSFILDTVMPNKTNSYPSFKWTLSYDLEGYSTPSVEKLVNDMNYIKEKYTTSPSYLKIDGKPVIFVYNLMEPGSNSSDVLERWSKVRNTTGFYTVLKADPLQDGFSPSLMDGWYEYDPLKRFGQQDGYYAFVSPGFWKYHDSPILARNVTEFEKAVQRLSSADVHFKLIETWNEYFEGSQIEPSMEITHDDRNGFRPNAVSYGTTYIDILAKYFGNGQ
jgi:hypothetical protein